MNSEHEMLSDEQKLTMLRKCARQSFDALDQGEGLTLSGEKQLSAAVARIGRRAAEVGSVPREAGPQ